MTHKCGSIVVADSRVVGHQCGDAVPYFVNPDIATDYLTYLNKIPRKITFAYRSSGSGSKKEVIFLIFIKYGSVC